MGKSFIGPTDTPIESDESGVVVDPDDVTLILDTVNSTMAASEPQLTTDDVEMTTVGVRPLIRETANDDDAQDAGTYSASRAHELYHHADHGVDNLWSIGGGKWTTGRATAEEMVDELLKNELKMVRSRPFDSRSSAAGGAFAWAEDAEPFITEAAMAMNEHGIPVHLGEHIARLYAPSGFVLMPSFNKIQNSPVSCHRSAMTSRPRLSSPSPKKVRAHCRTSSIVVWLSALLVRSVAKCLSALHQLRALFWVGMSWRFKMRFAMSSIDGP
jgi:glycerol-3-phosphate dehydrogenase